MTTVPPAGDRTAKRADEEPRPARADTGQPGLRARLRRIRPIAPVRGNRPEPGPGSCRRARRTPPGRGPPAPVPGRATSLRPCHLVLPATDSPGRGANARAVPLASRCRRHAVPATVAAPRPPNLGPHPAGTVVSPRPVPAVVRTHAAILLADPPTCTTSRAPWHRGTASNVAVPVVSAQPAADRPAPSPGVDVVARSGHCRVRHEVHRQLGDVRGADHPGERQPHGQVVVTHEGHGE